MRLPIHINEHSAEPLYHQIESQLRTLIMSGQLEENTLLPSNRELAQNLQCSLITIRRVYQDLEAEGLLRTKQGTGTFVAKVDVEAGAKQRLEAVEAAISAAVDAGASAGLGRAELESMLREELERRRMT
ncbi:MULTISPECIES: GntR family transcriptional regulator [unclassified Paenibacillus]|uniref:GntR family transcriptional regulator n=1 Tax=unclassified Paenibacillus TaxID=185978 RepID=UPI000955E6DB|nr:MULTISPECIES: GntR family transcriptional regulator [unclassified Paenibacillus]ASS68528.1 GntR family transcriptional regulator [Paenibacillus sp. RUD330]SIR36211.1 GntR family transcriptional regulator [Paenibacillus sp. RU4X]SIR46785.1 GntR family transcriptional regulator [Paenibacillus sp. RU4T]